MGSLSDVIKILAVPVALLLLAGCSPTSQRPAVVGVATQFVNAIDKHDGKAACKTLTDNAQSGAGGAMNTPCQKAVLNVKENGSSIHGVQIWGDSAQVKIGGDVLFLRHLKTGWLIDAAGCMPQPHVAYKCDVGG